LVVLQLKYDVVISAYTLLELPSARTRLETILNLWNKTDKYLVIVEHGTNAGFKVSVGSNSCFPQ
jgi:ribosomal protein RSM22 (predicted rRNA methylase)